MMKIYFYRQTAENYNKHIEWKVIWLVLFGSFINALGIILGTIIGLLLRKIPDK